MKRLLVGILSLLLLAAAGLAGWVFVQASAYDHSLAKKYELPLPSVTRSDSPEVLTRGKHLAESLGGCIACHGPNLAGGKVEDMGPIGRIVHTNLTPGRNGRLSEYSDAELARLLRHGVKRDGTTVRLMPVTEIYWWPDSDRDALISYLRSLPSVDGPEPRVEFSVMAKVLDRLDSIPIDVARRVDHAASPSTVLPAPTAAYGEQLGKICRGCHGEKHMAGGPIFGAPPDFPPPANLTPHPTGLGGWSLEDFKKALRTGVRKDGQRMAAFMPVDSFKHWTDLEFEALWAYLRSLPAVPYGER